jgi:hypothetical protein
MILKITVETEDGTFLDQTTMDAPEGVEYLAVKPVAYSEPHNQWEEILIISDL